MNRMSFVSNPCINIYINDDEPFQIGPERIPAILHDSLSACTRKGKETILALSIFIDEEYDNYVRALVTAWDGTIVSKHMYKLFGDGSYDISKYYQTQVL